MKIEGSREFGARRDEVYEALTDAELVARSIPALESLSVADHDHWTATMKIPVAPRLKVFFEVLDQRPPRHARLYAHGKSFGASAAVDTSFDLAQRDGRTTMRYDARFTLSGLLGRIGEPALRPIAERQVEKLLRAVEQRVAQR
jgi:carbon monoxide dehydrogenase subunit G